MEDEKEAARWGCLGPWTSVCPGAGEVHEGPLEVDQSTWRWDGNREQSSWPEVEGRWTVTT